MPTQALVFFATSGCGLCLNDIRLRKIMKIQTMKKRPSLRPRSIGVLRTDAAGFADNADNALVILELSRQEIDSANVAGALERLHVLTDTSANVLRYRESLIFQVTGYDADSRELPEIPAVRSFFKALAAEWPHWFWFLPRRVELVRLLLSLLCPVRIARGPKGTCAIEFNDREEVLRVCRDLGERTQPLFVALGIPIEAAALSTESAMAEVAGSPDGT